VPPTASPPSTSRLRRAWTYAGVALIVVVLYLSLTPFIVSLPGEQGDKFGHGLAYTALMFWFAHLVPGGDARKRLALAFIGMGIAVECVQGLTTYRTFSIADMAANTLGVLLGWVVAPPRVPSLLRLLEASAPGRFR
jgi:VanZ family protein